jgi:4'-phosphopantetheinyl transferase
MNSEIDCAYISNITVNNCIHHSFVIGNAIDAWQISISQNLHAINDYKSLLSADELARAGRYLQQKDRERFITSRAALRILLGKYLKIPAAELVFHLGENKKPFVKSNNNIDIHYNVSHSGDYILIAVAGSAVGADIEKINPEFSYIDILEQVFSLYEITHIQHSANPVETFYRLWTRKEALLKATSKGIDDAIKQVSCLDGYHIVDIAVTGAPGHWFITSFNVDNDYVGSIAGSSNCINHKQFFF